MLDKYMPNVDPGEPQTLKTSLADMKLYSVTASDRQTANVVDGDEEGTDATTTILTTTSGDDVESDEEPSEGGGKLDIPAKFLSSAEIDGSIGVAVSTTMLFYSQY